MGVDVGARTALVVGGGIGGLASAIARRSALAGRLAQGSSPAAAGLRDRVARLLPPAALLRAIGPMLDWR